MGRSESNLDPAMAQILSARTAAAAAAAADAQAAADALAAETAERLAAAAATTPIERAAADALAPTGGTPTLAGSDRPDGLDDIVGATTVTGGVAGVAASLNDLGAMVDGASVSSRAGLPNLDIGGSDRAGMLGLPGLDGILSGAAGASALGDAAPSPGFSSGGGGFSKSSISDGDSWGSDVSVRDLIDHPFLTAAKLSVDSVDAAAETLEEAGDWAREAASDTKDVADAVYDWATSDSDDADSGDSASGTEGSGAPAGTDDSAGTAPAGGDDSEEEWVRWSEADVPLGPKTQQEDADYDYLVWEMQQENDGDSGSDSGGEGAGEGGGSTDVKKVLQGEGDLNGNPYSSAYADLLAGVTGRTGSGGSSPLGPSGGGTTTNPGPESDAPAERGAVDLSGATVYSGVKDPPKPVDGPTVLDPTKLEAAPEGADPGAINPGDPNASTAASTPYDSTGPGEMSDEEFQAPASDNPADDPFADPAGHGRGAAFGQGHGRGHDGRGHEDGSADLAQDDVE